MAHVPLCSNLIANWPTQKILAQPKASIHLLLKARKPAKAGILEEKGEKVSDFLIY